VLAGMLTETGIGTPPRMASNAMSNEKWKWRSLGSERPKNGISQGIDPYA
jgi:hypothetical protein